MLHPWERPKIEHALRMAHIEVRNNGIIAAAQVLVSSLLWSGGSTGAAGVFLGLAIATVWRIVVVKTVAAECSRQLADDNPERRL